MKHLLSIFALVLIGAYAYGQCTPTVTVAQYPDGTFQPAPDPGLPCAIVGQSYSEVLEFIIPDQFEFQPGTFVPLDSISVNNVTGQPAEFGYQCGVASCVWPSATPGCAVFESANPQTLGDHTIVIDATIYATVATVPVSIDTMVQDYVIRVKADQAAHDADTFCTNAIAGIYSYDLPGVDALYNTPNPFMDNTKVKFTADNPADYTFQVHNLMGELIYEQEVTARTGQNTINFDGSTLGSGVYFYNITDGNKALTTRMVKM